MRPSYDFLSSLVCKDTIIIKDSIIPLYIFNNQVKYIFDRDMNARTSNLILLYKKENEFLNPDLYPDNLVLKVFAKNKLHFLEKEKIILSKLSLNYNDRIVRGVILDNKYVLMEYFSGDLNNLKKKLILIYDRLTRDMMLILLKEVKLILDYLESIDLINMDVKLENFVYSYDEINNKYYVYLIDYSSLVNIGIVPCFVSTYPRFSIVSVNDRNANKLDHTFGLFIIGFRLLYSETTFERIIKAKNRLSKLATKLNIDYSDIFKLLTFSRLELNSNKDNEYVEFDKKEINTVIKKINIFLNSLDDLYTLDHLKNICHKKTYTDYFDFLKYQLFKSYDGVSI